MAWPPQRRLSGYPWVERRVPEPGFLSARRPQACLPILPIIRLCWSRLVFSVDADYPVRSRCAEDVLPKLGTSFC